jgi:hypothetical protein
MRSFDGRVLGVLALLMLILIDKTLPCSEVSDSNHQNSNTPRKRYEIIGKLVRNNSLSAVSACSSWPCVFFVGIDLALNRWTIVSSRVHVTQTSNLVASNQPILTSTHATQVMMI